MKISLIESIEEACIHSKDNIIFKVSDKFLKLIGYKQDDIVGKSIRELSVLLKSNSQMYFQDIEDTHSLYIFTNEDIPIDVTITYKIVTKENIKMYLFEENVNSLLKNILVNFYNLSINNKEALAIYSYPDCICLKSNRKYNDSLNLINNKADNHLGEPHPHPKYVSRILEEGGSFHEHEVEFIDTNGIVTYWDINLRLMHGEPGKIILTSSLYDVTDRVLQMKLLDKQRIEMEIILKNISDVINIVNNKGEFTYINKVGLDKLAPYTSDITSLDDKEQFKFFKYFDIDGNELLFENTPVQRVLRGEKFDNYIIVETSHLPTTYHECNGIPIYDDLGIIDGGILTYRDIGDRIHIEEARLIETQKELLTKVVEAMDREFIRCTYPELEIISINGNGFNILKEINNGIKSIVCPIGESYFAVYPIDEETKRKDLELYLIEKGYYSYTDYTNHIIEGEQRFFKTINQPIFALNNKIVEIIFITTDITDEVKAKNKIEETIEMQNQMFANISHELRTPLSVISSSSQLIELYLKKEMDMIYKVNISESINIIKQNCFRFTKLINNIVDLSRIESGFYKLDFNNINIILITEDIVDSVRVYVEDKGLNIIFDAEIEEKVMAVDVNKMERILLNLISNAVKFSPKGSNIYIEIKDKKDFIDILVRDSGTGIDKMHLDTIFDKYKKVDNSLNRNAEGTGIGLALVKIMVELLGGKISVESELGKGCLFTVSLPVKVLDESEVINTIEQTDARIGQMNIEFSDIYLK